MSGVVHISLRFDLIRILRICACVHLFIQLLCMIRYVSILIIIVAVELHYGNNIKLFDSFGVSGWLVPLTTYHRIFVF